MGAIEALLIVVVALVIGIFGGGVVLVKQLGEIAKNPKVIEETREAYKNSGEQVKEVIQLAYSLLRLAETLSVTVVPASHLTKVIDKSEDVLSAIVNPPPGEATPSG